MVTQHFKIIFDRSTLSPYRATGKLSFLGNRRHRASRPKHFSAESAEKRKGILPEISRPSNHGQPSIFHLTAANQFPHSPPCALSSQGYFITSSVAAALLPSRSQRLFAPGRAHPLRPLTPPFGIWRVQCTTHLDTTTSPIPQLAFARTTAASWNIILSKKYTR